MTSVEQACHTMSALNSVIVPVATSRRDLSAAPSAFCSSVNSKTPLEMTVCSKAGRQADHAA
jgi:hypothetical protein